MTRSRSHDDCTRLAIADGEVGMVSLCPGCGVLHLQLEYMTLRLTPAAFRDLAQLLGQAQQRLDAAADVAPASSLAAGRGGWH